MNSTVNKEKKRKAHIDDLMRGLKLLDEVNLENECHQKQIQAKALRLNIGRGKGPGRSISTNSRHISQARAQSTLKEKSKFALQKMALEDRETLESYSEHKSELKVLEEKKKKLAKKIMGPMLEKKGIYFNKRKMDEKGMEVLYDRLMEARGENGEKGGYCQKCGIFGRECGLHQKEEEWEIEAKRLQNKVTGNPYVGDVDGRHIPYDQRLKYRIDPEARDFRKAKTPVKDIYLTSRSRTPTKPRAKTPQKTTREISPSSRLLSPIKHHKTHHKECLTRTPQYEDSSLDFDYQKNQTRAPNPYIHETLFLDAALQKKHLSKLQKSHFDKLFKPTISVVPANKFILANVIKDYDKKIKKTIDEDEKRETLFVNEIPVGNKKKTDERYVRISNYK